MNNNFTENMELFIRFTEAKPDVVEYLRVVDKKVSDDEYLKNFAMSLKKMVYYDGERELFGKAVDLAKPWFSKKLGDYSGIFPLYILTLGMEIIIERYNQLQIPLEILKKTLSEPNMAIDYYRNKFNRPGILHYHWTPFYFLPRNFRIDRLNFIAAPFRSSFAVFKNKATGQKLTLCSSIVEVLPTGYINGTNGTKDINAYSTIFELDSDSVTGNVVDIYNGIITPEVINLKMSDWDAVLLPGDPILEVHIPADGRLDCAECDVSFRRAVEFYKRYYPEYGFKAFTCSSWLIDSKLREFLPSDSNTVRFMELYDKFPVFSTKPAIFGWIYDHDFNPEDVFTVPPKTSMQKNLVEYLRSGREVYTGGGYILRERYE